MNKLFKILFLGCIILVVNITILNAQRVVKKYDNAITGNPIALAFGVLDATYEMALSNENSFSAGLRISNYRGWSGVGFFASYRWYIFQQQYKMLKGLSFGPIATLDFLSYETAAFKNSTPLGVGGEVAYKWIFEGGFVVEPVIKIHFNIINFDGSDRYRPFTFGINVGYAF